MNVSFGTFAIQCAALTVWVFLAVAIYALVEKYLDKHYPGFLHVEPEADDQAAAPVAVTDASKRA